MMNKTNAKFILILIILLLLGSIMIYSASYPYAKSHFDDGAYYIKKHCVFLLIGIITMIGISLIPVKIIKKVSLPFYLICLILLIIVLLAGSSEGVAKRWLVIPGTSISFQPSEFMKLGLTLALGVYYSKNVKNKNNILREIIIPGIILFSSCGLVLIEKHLSGTIILAAIGLSIIFVSGASVKKMLVFYGTSALIGAGAFLLTNSYAMKRITSFFDSNADILSDKWQTTQGLYAIGSGGLFGLGLGNSRQKYSYVSEPQNDFIFTIWCEEMGFIGAIILIFLFILLIYYGYKISFNSKDTFSSIAVFGIITQIAIQAALNMAVVTDLLPNTGISLPFFSYGGSSLIILLAEMGIVLSVSKNL